MHGGAVQPVGQHLLCLYASLRFFSRRCKTCRRRLGTIGRAQGGCARAHGARPHLAARLLLLGILCPEGATPGPWNDTSARAALSIQHDLGPQQRNTMLLVSHVTPFTRSYPHIPKGRSVYRSAAPHPKTWRAGPWPPPGFSPYIAPRLLGPRCFSCPCRA